MDGSIAASASLRMRDQLRNACHVPAGGGDAGLFEELLRMPVAESRLEPDADGPTAVEEAQLQAPAPEASPKPSDETQREVDVDDDDVDDEAVEEEYLNSVDSVAFVQALPTQVNTAEPSSQPPGEEVVRADTTEHTQPIVSPTPSKEPATTEPHVAAEVVARSSEPVDGTVTPVQENEVISAAPVVEAPVEAQIAPAAESNTADDQLPVTAASSLEGEPDRSDQTPHPTAEAKSPKTAPSQAQSPALATSVQVQSQPESQSNSQLDDQPRAQSVEQTPALASIPADDETSAKSEVQTEEDEPREKWFLQDDAEPRSEDTEAAAPSASQDSSAHDALTPSVADSANSLTNSDVLGVPDSVQTDGSVPSAAADISALASTLAQQSVSGNAASPRSDARTTSSGAGQVTGGRAASGSASQAAGAGSPDRDNGGVAGLSQQERVRLVQRVARSFSRLGPDGGQVTLKLHPPQLGVLNMSVRIEGQTMTAKLQTETTGARDAILENLTVLRERLAEQGIEIESFQVEVASDRNLTDDNQSQSQAHNPFSGDSAGGSRSGSRSIDYRRLSRSNSDAQTAVAGAMRGIDQARWPVHSSLERTLDIRA